MSGLIHRGVITGGGTVPNGLPSIPGADGQDGSEGMPGQRGADGAAGQIGPTGLMGPPGVGTDGDDGAMGPPGLQGATGPAGAATDPTVQSYSPGSFTVATEKYAVASRHLKFTGTQRVTLQGTATLRIT